MDTVIEVKELLYRMDADDQAVMLACARLLDARRRGILSTKSAAELKMFGEWLAFAQNLPGVTP